MRQKISIFIFALFIALSGFIVKTVYQKKDVRSSVNIPAMEKNLQESNATSTQKRLSIKPIKKIPALVEPEIKLPPKILVLPAEPQITSAPATTTPAIHEPVLPKPALPPLDEEAILKAVVKIECPSEDGQGKYVATGFVIRERTVVTAAHVLMNSGSRTCSVIFPRERRPTYFLQGETEDLSAVKNRHNEDGIDVAIITLPPLESYPEARAIFEKYPVVPYPICMDPHILEDALLHFGYPSNFLDQSYLSRLEGVVVAFADINGIKDQLSEDKTFSFKSPIFAYTLNEQFVHPYGVSRVPSFYGDSGGLAFNAVKQCIAGTHRGGTIGKSAGENYTVFMNLGWEKAEVPLP